MATKPTYEELEKRILELEQAEIERKQSDEALQENEAYLRTLIRTIPDLVWLKDPKGLYLFCKSRFEQMFGAKEADIIGKTDYDFVDKDLAEFFRRCDTIAIAEGKPCKNEEVVTFADDGHRETLETIKTPIFMNDGRLIGVLGIGRDITERKKTEDNFKQLVALHQTILDTVSVGIIFIKDRTTQWTNRAITTLFGYESNELLGQNASIYYGNLEMYKKVGTEGYPRLVKGETYSVELEGRKKDGSLFWCNLVGKAIDPQNISEGSIWVAQDITERKKLEERISQMQKIESIGRLAGGIAHDFNNILGVIIGNTEIALENAQPDDPFFEHLHLILDAADRSTALTHQLLAFARKQTIAPKILDLNATLSGMLKMLRTLIGEAIELIWLPADKVWPVKIDPSQLDQILANLCINARDAISDVGKVIIETKNVFLDENYCLNHPESIPGDYVMLSVSDNGSGMDKSTINKIFEPFFTTKGLGKGTGLGLATVYGNIKQNNGFIDVYSEPGVGTTFKIFLPRYISTADKIQHEAPTVGYARGDETILLVEDDPTNLKTTMAMLEKLGYQVLAAANPTEALIVARKHIDEIRLLLSDVIMPDMNGKVLSENITALSPKVKCLFMSGYTDNVIAHHGVLEEGIHFIQKPFSLRSLAIKIREALDVK